MKESQIISEISPGELRDEIIFAKQRVEYFSQYSKITGFDHRSLGAWVNILNGFVKQIVPVE